MFEDDYKYRITEEGIKENKSFRRRVERWLDGSLTGAVNWRRENEVLAVFARYPTVGLTKGELYNKTEFFPGVIKSTVSDLQDRGVIERAYRPSKEPYLPAQGHPETYGDWVDISQEIKSRVPSLAGTVNEYMQDIMEETERADSAKAWLTEKAGELAII